MTPKKCSWVFGKRKCPNQKHRYHEKFCVRHIDLEERIEGYDRARSFLAAASKLVSESGDKARHAVYSEYIQGGEGWSMELIKLTATIDRQRNSMDSVWNTALPRLERNAIKKRRSDD